MEILNDAWKERNRFRITVNKPKVQEPLQVEEEKRVDAPGDDRAASLGNPAKIPTHVTGEGTDTRVPRPAKKTIKEPMVSQASKAIKKNSGTPKKKKGGR
jgi:hypothetical protein